IMDVASGKVTRIERVAGYQVNEEGAPWLAYRKAPPGKRDDAPKAEPQPKADTPAPPAPPTASELVLRNLADGKERTFADVTEFRLAKDGRCLVFAVTGKKDEDSGIRAVTPGQESLPVVLRSGPGKYARLTWDEKQTRLAFFHTITPKAADGQPQPRAEV